ncbi:putative bifunctional diguanylate cyclase/phosphodiesterase [Kaarinaea lacus]
MKFQFLNSLRGRFTVFAIIMAILVIVVAIAGHWNASFISAESAANLGSRHQLQQYGHNIRISLFDGYKNLHAFLLDPTRGEFKDKTHSAIQTTIRYSEELKDNPWIKAHNRQDIVANLHANLRELNQDFDELIQTRIEPTMQYPSLALANRTLRPSRININNALAVMLNEMKEDGTANRDAEVYRAVLETRHLWSQMLSNFRLYLANRVGSFNESVLPVQEAAVDTMHVQLTEQLGKLKAFIEQERLGFQSSVAFEDLQSNLDNWHNGFTRVKEIHHSENWRADTAFIKDRIEPRLEGISRLLELLDKEIENSATLDLQALTNVTALQTNILFIIAGFGLAYLGMAVVSMQRLIFKPIETVAKALKAEAFGKEGVVLPTVRSKETQNLIDAFAEMRKQVHMRQAELVHQALHDGLTNLPNRTLLHDRVDHAIHLARREHKHFALLMMDLDRFKEVNDTLGHHVGDNLLVEVGKRLFRTLREIDTVARLGGDEFAILLPNAEIDQARGTAQKILDSLEEVFAIDELNLYINASIGIADYPEHGTDVSTLLQRADVAMYVAKRNKLGVAVYDKKDDEYSVGRLSLMSDLRQAIENDVLDLHFQPKFDMYSGTVIGAEALLRWDHATYGSIPPDQIVTLSEQTGLIDSLSYWVLSNAIKQCSIWRTQGLDFSVAVNLSVYNLKDPALVDHIKSLLSEHNMPHDALMLEITESAMMANPMQSMETLSQIDSMGVQLAIDDFGTGFSSLAYLKQLPVDELKIDKSFVMDLIKDENDEMIVRSTIELAHNMGLNVVAEGVECGETYRMLQELGCDMAQGYFLSPPLKTSHMDKWLRHDADILTQEIRKIQNF